MNYYIIQGEEIKGPYTIGQMRTMWSAGNITSLTMHAKDGDTEWQPLSAILDQLESPNVNLPTEVATTTPIPTKGLGGLKQAIKDSEEKDPEKAKKTKEGCQSGCLIIFVAFALIIVIGSIFGSHDQNSTPSSSSDSTGTSTSFNIGAKDGRTAGQLDARSRHTKMGDMTCREEAHRNSAPLEGTPLSRDDYESGWRAGYSTGYDSYSR